MLDSNEFSRQTSLPRWNVQCLSINFSSEAGMCIQCRQRCTRSKLHVLLPQTTEFLERCERFRCGVLSELWPSVKIWVDINVDVNSTTTSHWVWFLKPQRCGSQTQNVVQKPLRGSQHEFLHVLHHALLNSARWRANFTRGFGSEHPSEKWPMLSLDRGTFSCCSFTRWRTP